ncbi:MAG: Intracellular exo-alpha-(1-_5)-L-arabinofuranosidase 1 [candidate division TA06 bacterium ADurb.Bin131]|jgi:alpha-N-arabinofuranosidase|uniref:non-reducing end alpha-L-arabinofuranosidase n=1 Tax=candidate division TA06 bacterium ADurb.Bin131 TaxID=1852827 RepID=A0A1V6CE62_UNCT6|nr:MAG: Intracellular exo-alpha-(1->5)-L-arabinofuranosidase 1 [candidate division TA06 bacterium ADurb.Bin131]HOC02351.1 alpha-L-arabinofuranosidase C-terminal domain-containing protein [bacterium]HRV04541.1 alpha-L-arabinofuranosidase C-terminal domain-containing protein [Candidatus Ratteibacteria bacterium]
MKSYIIIDSSKVIGKKNQNFFGSFIEHVHNCLYPGIFDPQSIFADKNGLRKDVLEEIKKLKLGTIRWPGGNFSSWYHWIDGVGPAKNRKRKLSYADDITREESNLFGTDEYIRFCRETGTQPYITVNAGNGTSLEAANWVEYCNSSGNTFYANLRRENGNIQPFNVKYWEIGNEIYGDWQVGTKNANQYSQTLSEFSKAMKRVDPSINIIAVGMGKHDPDWDRIILDNCWDYIDNISVHIYIGRHEYFDSFGQVFTIADHLRKMEDDIINISQQKQTNHRIGLALSEWGVWYRKGHKDDLDEVYNLKDALVFASSMNLLLRFCRTLDFSHQSMLVNCVGLMRTKPDALVKQTVYYPFILFAKETGDVVLAPEVWSDGFSCKDYRYFPWPTFDVGKDNFQMDESSVPEIHNVPYLDVSATYDSKENKICIIAVNRHPEKTLSASIELRGYRHKDTVSVSVVNGPDIYSINDFDEENVKMEQYQEKIKSDTNLQWDFPAHSITMLKIQNS